MTTVEFIVMVLLGVIASALGLVSLYSAVNDDWLLAGVSAIASVIFTSVIFRKDGEPL